MQATVFTSRARCVVQRQSAAPVLRRQAIVRTARRGGVQRSKRVQVSAFQQGSSSTSMATAQSISSVDESQDAKKKNLTVSWAGAGLYFFWQLGAMKYLAERYDLTKVPMVGASGGALAAVLAACGVDADRVMQHAYDLSVRHNIWERPLGLLGVWGSLVEQWLDDLLPDNAHELCRGRITAVITTMPDMAQVGISDFTSKRDLIDACMASAHVPVLLDLKLTKRYRGRSCVDGSFPDFFTGMNSELLRCGGSAIVFDYYEDLALNRKGRMDMLALKSYQEIYRYYEVGYQYAAKLHAEGHFENYELAELLLQGRDGQPGMQEVLVPEHTPAQEVAEIAAAAAGAGQQGVGHRGLVLDLQQQQVQGQGQRRPVMQH